MARSKSDISNSAIRIFLQKVGRFYDQERGFSPFTPTKPQKEELVEFFSYQCCFCGTDVNIKTLSQDHLIPMNKEHLGLHAWGNVVPCCKDCNSSKQQRDWQLFLAEKCSGTLFEEREAKIHDFVSHKQYDPTLDLHDYAGNLYQDIGEVAMTLIDLRYNQAANAISLLVKDE